MNDTSARNRKWIWLLVGILFVLHHDFWLWDNPSLLLGFLPVGLAYHLLFSIVASALWFAMVRYGWPGHIEDFADGKDLPTRPEEKRP
jgi:hypothetical protein